MAEAPRRAVAAFKPTIGVGVDGFHPEAPVDLTDESREKWKWRVKSLRDVFHQAVTPLVCLCLAGRPLFELMLVFLAIIHSLMCLAFRYDQMCFLYIIGLA